MCLSFFVARSFGGDITGDRSCIQASRGRCTQQGTWYSRQSYTLQFGNTATSHPAVIRLPFPIVNMTQPHHPAAKRPNLFITTTTHPHNLQRSPRVAAQRHLANLILFCNENSIFPTGLGNCGPEQSRSAFVHGAS